MTKTTAVATRPSGATHAYVVSEVLESATETKSWEVEVRTQGSIDPESGLAAKDVTSVDMVILTKDISIKFEERSASKTIMCVNIGDVVKRADAIINKTEAHLMQAA